MNWILILAFVIFTIVMYKFRETGHKFRLVTITVIGLFFTISLMLIYTRNDIDLTTLQGLITAGKLYLSWLTQMFDNIVKVSGNVIKMDWGINASSITK